MRSTQSNPQLSASELFSPFYERAFFIRDVMTLRGSLAAQEAFNRSTRPIGQRLALLGFLHSPGSRSLTYYANLGLWIRLPPMPKHVGSQNALNAGKVTPYSARRPANPAQQSCAGRVRSNAYSGTKHATGMFTQASCTRQSHAR